MNCRAPEYIGDVIIKHGPLNHESQETGRNKTWNTIGRWNSPPKIRIQKHVEYAKNGDMFLQQGEKSKSMNHEFYSLNTEFIKKREDLTHMLPF